MTSLQPEPSATPHLTDQPPLRIGSPEDLAPIGQLLSAMRIGLTLVDRSMRVVWANDATRLLADELRVGRHHCFSALWKRRDRCPDCLSLLVFRTGEAQDGIRERGRPGRPAEPYRVRSIPVFDEAGELQWVAETLVPLPALPSERVYRLHPPPRALSTGGTSALIVVDTLERIVSWSPAAEAILGYAVEEVLGRRIDLIVPESAQQEESRVAGQVRAEGSVARFETARKAKDGRLVPVALWAEALRDEGGSIIGRTCWIEDLSAVERLRRRVVEQERMLAHITHAVDDAIVALDTNGVIRSWNRGAERWFGHAAHEVLGTSLASVVGEEALQALLSKIRREPATQTARMQWRDAQGELVPVEVSGSMVRSGDDANELVALVARDVTEQLRLDRQLVRSEKMAVVGSLAAGLAHEIGTPLNVISATAEYLMLDAREAQQRKELEGIVAETDRISRLVRDLLSFARGERRGVMDVDLAATVERVVGLTRITLDKRHLSVDVGVDSSLPPLSMEPDGLHQLLLNLLMNAVAAVPDGGRIGIRAKLLRGQSPPRVAIEVHDDGPGVPGDLTERIFDPFFTTRPDGTGLGLAVCARIVSTHGGDIRVARGPWGGASFVVQLPVRQETAS